jgi:hypothetical protein
VNDFRARFGAGVQWEKQLPDKLAVWGWDTTLFGQAQIPENFRDVLRDYEDSYGRPSLIRWLPDLLATRSGQICLIDAKTDSGSTPNYAVELDALRVGKAIVDHMFTPVYYVWPDGNVLTPRLVEQKVNRQMDGKNAKGSRTTFLLVDKCWALKAERVFGPPHPNAGAA